MSVVTRNQSNASTSSIVQYVSFWVDEQLLGVPVMSIQEVLNGQQIARTPRASREIAGLLNLRGQIVTAVDLRFRLGLPQGPDHTECMNVVIRHNGEPYSLLVDEVGDVIDVDQNQIGPVPRTLDAHWRSVTSGVVQLPSGLFVILNATEVLSFV